jgi:DNA-binding beta-propeller fold protein YncE
MQAPFNRGLRALCAALAIPLASMALPAAQALAASPSFIEFESGQVRPIALSPDGTKLFAVNTPNGTLDVFKVTDAGLVLQTRVPVGLEPVAVAARTNSEVWVVNHVSDSVSIVSLDGVPHVTRTLLVGDEPRDIVFAGAPAKAFITTAHRGQQRTDASLANVPGSGDPKLTTPGVSRADVWVFDPASLGTALGGVPLRIMSFFADTPRALAVSPDKSTLYVAAFKSGNETSSVNEYLICDGYDTAKTCSVKGVTMPGGQLGPQTDASGQPAPKTGLLVKYNRTNKHWEDVLGRNWDAAVPYNLPDKDVFAVDANALTEKVAYQHVGTVLFNMVANPVSGKLYVSNTEANNMTRFEGPGVYGGSTVQGKIALARVTVISGTNVLPRHLNKHIDYTKLANDPGFDPTTKSHSLATPMEMAVTKDGGTMYVTAYGSSRIGVFNTADIENDTFNPRTASARYITVSGGGPSGVVLDENRGRMYVMTRFDNALKVVDLASRTEVAAVPLVNPEPDSVLKGRPFLYDAQRSSANGEASCAACHIFGEADNLAWDLGNPDGAVTKSTLPGKFTEGTEFQGAKILFNIKTKINGSDDTKDFHPMKGPMITQTLRGLPDSGALHWRGDRSTGVFGTDPKDTNLSFKNFAVAFEGLLGNPGPATEAEMQAFSDYQLQVMYPPNPIRNLDNSLTAQQQRGSDFYFGARPVDGIKLSILGVEVSHFNNCNGCHTFDPANGNFGASGFASFEGISQIVKVAQLRGLYDKVGRFGFPAISFSSAKASGHQGDQVRGFGFVHDGTADTLAHFFTVNVFRPTLNSGFPLFNPDKTRVDVSEFMHVFPSDLPPIAGQQVTLTSTNASSASTRVDLLIKRAKAPFVSKRLGGTVTECDLVARVVENGVLRGYLFDVASGAFKAADGSSKADNMLRAMSVMPGQEVTYTCATPGSGARVAYNL